jgi:DNA adenine methylase
MEIAQKADRIRFAQGDAFEVLSRYGSEPETTFLLDPPYTAGGKRAGARLYRHWELDHARLFEACCHLHGDFLMTYDAAPEIHVLATRHGLEVRRCLMKGSIQRQMPELLMGRNLEWM